MTFRLRNRLDRPTNVESLWLVKSDNTFADSIVVASYTKIPSNYNKSKVLEIVFHEKKIEILISVIPIDSSPAPYQFCEWRRKFPFRPSNPWDSWEFLSFSPLVTRVKVYSYCYKRQISHDGALY